LEKIYFEQGQSEIIKQAAAHQAACLPRHEPPARLPRPLAPSQHGSLLPHAARVPRPSNAAPPYVLPCLTPYEAARSSSPCPRCPLPWSCSHSTYIGAAVPYPGVLAIPSGQPSCPPAPPRTSSLQDRGTDSTPTIRRSTTCFVLCVSLSSIGCTPSTCEDHVWFEDRWMVASLCDE
jgi:hypothetical protein